MGFFDKEKKQFSNTDLAIYHFILNNYERVSSMRVRDIANEVPASASSVMRFVHKMGYASYPEFREALRKEAADETETVKDYWTEAQASLEREHYSADLLKNLHMLAQRVHHSENIVFLGIGISGILSAYGARRLATLGYNSFEVTDTYYPLQPRLYNTTDNVMIIISNSGETPDLIDMVAYHQANPDFYLVCLTGAPNSTLARMSHLVLSHGGEKERKYGFYDVSSQLPAMFILESLMNEVEQVTDRSPQ